jgi:peptide/nickel transport system permease protein
MARVVKKTINKNNSYWRETWRRFKKNRMAMFGLFVLIVLAVVAIFAEQLAPYGYDDQNAQTRFIAPCGQFPLGTDNFGRDILSRIIYGSQISLQVGLISVAISCVIGGVMGVLAAYYGSTLDIVIMRVLDVLMAIPGMILAIAIAASLGTGLNNMMIAIGLGHTPGFARVVRASVLSVKENVAITLIRQGHCWPRPATRMDLRRIFGLGISSYTWMPLRLLPINWPMAGLLPRLR